MSVSLTIRQLEFLSLSARGMQRPEIAACCFVAVSTVKQTLDEARDRLGARTLPQAVAIAIAFELLAVDGAGFAYPASDLIAA